MQHCCIISDNFPSANASNPEKMYCNFINTERLNRTKQKVLSPIELD